MEPKNSLEALDNLVHCKSETKCKECKHKNVCTLERDYNIVKSDLEMLDNENKVLKFENKILTEGLQDLDQDIQDVIADYQDAARKMFKYMNIIAILNRIDWQLGDDFTCGYAEYCNRYGDEDLAEEEYNLIMEGFAECTR